MLFLKDKILQGKMVKFPRKGNPNIPICMKKHVTSLKIRKTLIKIQ